MIICSLIVLYLLSFYYARKYFKISYSSGGCREHLKPEWFDICMVILPIYNTGFLLIYIVRTIYFEEINIPKKFFGIKN